MGFRYSQAFRGGLGGVLAGFADLGGAARGRRQGDGGRGGGLRSAGLALRKSAAAFD